MNNIVPPPAELRADPTLSHLSLCTGYGGLDMAVETVLGARTVAVSDVDPGACAVLAHRYPDVPNLGDMTTADWTPWVGVDVVSGGTPCQDLSHAGKRAGMSEGTRSNLWVAMRDCIAVTRPTYVVWENVRGAYSACADSEADRALGRCPRCVAPSSRADHAPNLRAIGRVVGDLSDLGYVGQVRGLRASDVGAVHERYRSFILARLADPESDARRVEHGDGSAVADARRQRHGSLVHPGHVGRVDGEDEGGSRERERTRGVASDRGAATAADPERIGRDGRAHGAWRGKVKRATAAGSGGVAWGPYEPAIRRWGRVLGRPAPAPTEPTGRGGAARLSPRFTEWMMGLPDGWITDVPGITRNQALKLCGNGVVPQQAEAALRDMVDALALAA